MDLAQLLKHFTEDPTVLLIGALVVLDVVLGISSAIYRKVFRFVLVADFLRADVMGKLIPYYAVWAAVHVTGDISLGGFELIEESTGALAVLAVGASVLNSLRELGLKRLPESVAADDPTTPG